MKVKHLAFTIVTILVCSKTMAQWTVGLRGGLSNTTISRYDGGRIDEAYSALNGFETGIQVNYTINSWLAIRANLSYMQRSHRMDRNLNYLNPVYTEHLNSYMMLPVTVDFSFGGEQLRGHLLTGAYAGYWLKECRRGTTYWMTDYNVYFENFDETREFTDEDVRLNAGVTFGAGLSYSLNSKLELGLDAIYYYDLTSHHKGYGQLTDPRYLNTLAINLVIGFRL